jgi:TonB family protein
MKTFLALVVIAALSVAVLAGEVSSSSEFRPKPILSEFPMYPELARMAHVAGIVKLWFVLNGNGEVTRAEIISGTPLLRDAAVSTVKSWKFQLDSIRPNVRYETEFIYVLDFQPIKGTPKLKVSMIDFRRVEIVSEIYEEPIE